MTIDNAGNVGIGTPSPVGALEVARTGDAVLIATTYQDLTNGDPFVFTRKARGTNTTPTAVQAGDLLGVFGGGGYGTTEFSAIQAGIGSFAAENFTDTAHGSSVVLASTPIGVPDAVIAMSILPSGFVGIGTPADAFGVLTATDRLQVFGDIRLGDTGTNGCIKNLAGTGIVGTCSSDRRLKKNITPFAPALDKVAALQPVNYFWRASEFPNRHFGNSRAYGLIAQDVEQVLPELVVTDGDGYKAVDYSQLPLLTIQAVKELKTENDALKHRVAGLSTDNERLAQRVAEIDPLKQRVAELERMMAAMLAATRR
jgi:hypothetical protein